MPDSSSENGERPLKCRKVAEEDSATVVAAAAAQAQAAAAWAATLERCIPAIVALRVSCLRPSELEGAGVSWGTGFVVDGEQGLLLTNRHVVGAGPARILATFDQHEELDVEVVYRDPLHDFAVLRFDPTGLTLTQRGVSLPLAPPSLRVGIEVRVIGNDDGEKLQILQGTIARVDRNAPNYSDGAGDENIFYAGCGSNCSGGASGSPVVNIDGEAVAILSGGSTNSACDFFLPLDRVKYALDLIRAKQPVPRGTIRVRFLFETWAQLKRLGFPELRSQECLKDRPELRGLLVVERPLEGSESQGRLLAGDVLLSLQLTRGESAEVGGEFQEVSIRTFTELEDALDRSVGAKAKVVLVRMGVEIVEGPFLVDDLLALSSSSLLECGSGVFQDLPYAAARAAQLPLGCGVMATESGFIFSPKVPDHAIISEVAGKVVHSVAEMAKILPTIAEGSYFEVRYIEKGKNAKRNVCRMLKMQRLFAPLAIIQEYRTECGELLWERSELPFPHPVGGAVARQPSSLSATCSSAERPVKDAPTLARVIFRTPCELATDIILDRQETSGTRTVERCGVGFLARRGIVITDRHVVPQPLGDVEVTFMQEITVQAKVLFLHPEHNLVLLSIDPLGEDYGVIPWLKDGELPSLDSCPPLRSGTPLKFVGLDTYGHEVVRQVSVAALVLPPASVSAPALGPPRFSERNCELLDLAEPLPTRWCGLLLTEQGSVAAFIALFACQMANGGRGTRSAGIPLEALSQLMRLVDRPSKVVPELGVDFEELTVAALRRERKFDELAATSTEGEQVASLKDWSPARQVVLCVCRLEKGGPADGLIKEGDVLVRAAGNYVSDGVLSLANIATQGEKLKLQVFRSGALTTVDAVPRAAGSDGSEQVVVWHGLVCVATPRALRRAALVPEEVLAEDNKAPAASSPAGVYVIRVCFGGPSQSTGMSARVFIMEVDGKPIRRLSDLPAPAPSTGLGADLRIRTVDHLGRASMETLRPDPTFWPSSSLTRSADGTWRREMQAEEETKSKT